MVIFLNYVSSLGQLDLIDRRIAADKWKNNSSLIFWTHQLDLIDRRIDCRIDRRIDDCWMDRLRRIEPPDWKIGRPIYFFESTLIQ